MNLTFKTYLTTEGKEKRLEGNDFYLVKEGYQIYPIETVIDLKRTEEALPTAQVCIKEIQWKNQQTIVTYELKALNSVN